MRCVNPFVTRQAAFGCGQCMPCRFNRRRVWTHRLMLEALDHGDSSFVTLTYSDENLPGDYSVHPEHFRNWLKRLRKRISPKRIRFYGVGEYGESSNRPHYHAALYGFPACFASGGSARQLGPCQCQPCSVVRETWGFGHVMLGRLELRSAQYIAGYVTKKMTHREDPRLNGRHPEFARMSLGSRKDGLGGIGANAMWNVASEMMRYNLSERRYQNDVPLSLAFGGRDLPLGRYLRKRLRVVCGLDEKAPESSLQTLANQLQIVRAFAWKNDRSVRSVFEEVNQPYATQLQARELLRGSREKV